LWLIKVLEQEKKLAAVEAPALQNYAPCTAAGRRACLRRRVGDGQRFSPAPAAWAAITTCKEHLLATVREILWKRYIEGG